jgi:proteasome lid subunit RPN8/RPN11
MIYSIRSIIQELIAPQCNLSCSNRLWAYGLKELRHRGMSGLRESGAFLLGTTTGEKKRIIRFIYYDDLEPHCLDTGCVVLTGTGYGPLWKICRESGLSVVADIHTHPGIAHQSDTDRKNPMVALAGHIALIVPNYAKRIVGPSNLGIYEYQGDHRWSSHGGKDAKSFFYIGLWG